MRYESPKLHLLTPKLSFQHPQIKVHAYCAPLQVTMAAVRTPLSPPTEHPPSHILEHFHLLILISTPKEACTAYKADAAERDLDLWDGFRRPNMRLYEVAMHTAPPTMLPSVTGSRFNVKKAAHVTGAPRTMPCRPIHGARENIWAHENDEHAGIPYNHRRV